MARPLDESLIGRTIAGKYVVESFIGGGAMGAVYKARQLSLDKAVAIKVLHADLSDPSFVARFQREAKAASKLDHPNSMRVLDYGKDGDGTCYIAMELLEGQSLFRILKDAHGPLGDVRTVDLVRQILAALAAAHDMGIIHRDLKPENIIVVETRGDDGNTTEVVKVCDFGMAKMMASETATEASIEKLTSRGVVIGTPEYMSPEQGKGEDLDARSDLYSVGVILYQMLSGRLPFIAESPIATLVKHLVEAPTPPSAHQPDVHAGLEAICLRAMSKTREDRFASAREMRSALRAAIEGTLAVAESQAVAGAAIGGNLGPGPADDVPLSLPRSSIRQPAARGPFASVPDSDLIDPLDATLAAPPTRPRAVDLLDASPPPRRSSPLGLIAVAAAVLAGGGFWMLRHHAAPPVATDAAPAPPAVSPPPAGTNEGTPATATPPPPQPPAAPAQPNPASAPTAGSTEPHPAAAAPTKAGKPGEPPSTPAGGPRPTSPAPVASSAPGRAPAAAASASTVAGPVATVPSWRPATPEMPSVAPAAVTTAVPFPNATVSFGSVRSSQAQAPDVVAALPSARFSRCYRDGLSAHATAMRGRGTLHITFGSDGHVTEASFAGPVDLASVGQCVAGAAIGSNVKNVEPGATGAEVDLSFKPD